MAYLAAGLTDGQLRKRFVAEAARLSPVELAARFGRPKAHATMPYWFLEQNGTRTYQDLPAPHYVDQQGRQYTPRGLGNRRELYIRLPIAKTRAENRENAPADERQDFPRPGEELELTNADTRPQKKNTKTTTSATAVRRVTVHRVTRPPGTYAVAVLLLNEELDDGDDDDDDDEDDDQDDDEEEEEKEEEELDAKLLASISKREKQFRQETLQHMSADDTEGSNLIAFPRDKKRKGGASGRRESAASASASSLSVPKMRLDTLARQAPIGIRSHGAHVLKKLRVGK